MNEKMRRNHRRARVQAVGVYFAFLALAWLVASPPDFGSAGSSNRPAAPLLSLSPASASHAAGDTFVVSVMLNSGGGVGVNAADGQLSFDPTLLAVQSVSKDNSVFNLWTSNPSFSNTAGTVSYSGGSNNAYTGNAGDVVDVTFKALAAGTASVKFSSATALAADGQGTNVLSGTTGATYTIGGTASSAGAQQFSTGANAGSSQSSAAAPAPAQTPFTVTITIASPTHPDPSQWYSNNSPNFTWTLTPDVAGVSTAFDQNPGTYPKRSSEGLISSKQYSAVGEGVWYFHVRFEDALGDWSDPVNFQINIDLTSPLPFTVTAISGAGISGRTELMFNATDTVSGVDHYIAVYSGWPGSSTLRCSPSPHSSSTAAATQASKRSRASMPVWRPSSAVARRSRSPSPCSPREPPWSSVGTYAGQVVMAGFIKVRISLYVRRVVTMIPALACWRWA